VDLEREAISARDSSRSDEGAMGGAGTAVAGGQEVRTAADVGQATAERRRDGTWHRIFTALQARADAKEVIA
jgi:hypothetical protein